MCKHIWCQGFDVVGRDIRPVLKRRIGAGRLHEGDCAAGRSADIEPNVVSRLVYDVHQISHHRFAHLDPIEHPAQLQGFLRGNDRLDRVDDILCIAPQRDTDLLFTMHIAELQPHHKPIHLRFGQRKGAIGFDGVLRCRDHKRIAQPPRFAVHRNLPFRHSLQQTRLCPRRGAVDLVSQHHVRKDRAGTKFKITRLHVVKMYTGHVAWHHVRCELYPFETAPASPGKRAEQHGLAGSRHILQEDMPPAKIADGDQGDLLLLADNGLRTNFDQTVAIGNELRNSHLFFLQICCGAHAWAGSFTWVRLMGFTALAAQKAPPGLFLYAASNPPSRIIWATLWWPGCFGAADGI